MASIFEKLWRLGPAAFVFKAIVAAIVGDAPAMTAQIVTRISDGSYDTLPLFETSLKPLRNAWRPDPFRF